MGHEPGRKDVAEADAPLGERVASEVRARAPTITDEVALEQARLASLPSDQPAPAEDPVARLRARLAPLGRVPSLAKQIDALGNLDPKTAFVLGFVDGLLPLETILDVAGMPELEVLEVLDRMITQNVIVFRDG